MQDDHANILCQIAETAATEQRRVVLFRDRWINKPLPYEQVRPMLTAIATTVRDQLTDYRDLTLAASRLIELGAPRASASPGGPEPQPTPRDFDRRALFNRLIRPEREKRGDD